MEGATGDDGVGYTGAGWDMVRGTTESTAGNYRGTIGGTTEGTADCLVLAWCLKSLILLYHSPNVDNVMWYTSFRGKKKPVRKFFSWEAISGHLSHSSCFSTVRRTFMATGDWV